MMIAAEVLSTVGKEGVPMARYLIDLSRIDQIRKFNEMAMRYPFDIELLSERFKINAKSMMGIFSMDLTQPIEVEVRADDLSDFEKDIETFLIKE